MKVLVVNSLYPPDVIGGAEISSHKLAMGLNRKGNEVFFLTTGEEDQVYTDNGVTVIKRRLKNITSFWAFKHSNSKISRVIYKIADIYNFFNRKIVSEVLDMVNPDIIHTNNIYGISAVIWTCAKKKKIPVVHTLRDYYLMCPKANLVSHGKNCQNPNFVCKIFRSFYRNQSKKVSVVTAPSNYTLNTFINDDFFPHSVKETVYNAIEYDKEKFDEIAKTKIGRKLTEINVIYIGSLIETKGITTLLEAIKIAPANMKFHFAGKGPLLENVKRAEAENPNVKYEGFLGEQELQEVLKKMDVLVCPSVWPEPFGRVIIDAYKSCLPVVATNCGGISELIDDGRTGIVIQPGKAEAIVDALQNISTWELDETRVDSIRSRLLEFSIDTQISKFSEIYNFILHK